VTGAEFLPKEIVMHWYVDVLKKYVEFNGRARRMEFWMFVLFQAIISVVLGWMDTLLGTEVKQTIVAGESVHVGFGVLRGLYTLATFLPSLALSVRRLHDTNKSGLWILIGIIPCIGQLILLLFYVKEGDKGSNQYGPDPIVGERASG
jgi:uncharacterized membrane protein YhaH (DUF805 family)